MQLYLTNVIDRLYHRPQTFMQLYHRLYRRQSCNCTTDNHAIVPQTLQSFLGFKALLTFEPQALFLGLDGQQSQRAGSIPAVADLEIDVETSAKEATRM